MIWSPNWLYSLLVQLLISSGNEDICYYNTRCATPLFNASAFNNIFSNIGYVILGILYIVVTYSKYVVCSCLAGYSVHACVNFIQTSSLSEVGKVQCWMCSWHKNRYSWIIWSLLCHWWASATTWLCMIIIILIASPVYVVFVLKWVFSCYFRMLSLASYNGVRAKELSVFIVNLGFVMMKCFLF